jgi:parallel beta-helix repeat protein
MAATPAPAAAQEPVPRYERQATAEWALQPVAVAPSDTVHVAPPTGEKNADRASVQAAFDAVRPGGTVQFAQGMYLLAGARLTVPDVTVLGHPAGTVLRGCDPEAFKVDATAMVQTVFGCTGLYVQAERQTIRGLTFEYTWYAIIVGPYPTTVEEAVALGGKLPPAYPVGGQRIEGNVFRATFNGLYMLGAGDEVSVVRDNDFIDVFHAIGIYGPPLHFLDNRVTVAEPEGVPFSRHPGSAVIVSPRQTDCTGHVVAGNRIEGYPDPVYVLVYRGQTCRSIEIRDNVIHAARVKVPAAYMGATPTADDSMMVGAPITLMNREESEPGLPDGDTEGVLEDILVEGNDIVGAEGLGILVQNASRNRIAGNTITGIQRRAPFPGITWDGFEQRWEAANGSAIWISAGSDENEIVGNTFQDIAASAVVIEGDRNHVELADPADVVRDLGTDNRVSGPDTTISSHAYESKFVDVGGVRLHYLDFGGEGLPILFTAGSRSAETWAGFAPRFTDRHRVLAITDRGVPPSEGEEGGFTRRAGDILALLDTLGIDRAVLVANSNPAQILIYLAEHHPERLAGLVFLAPDSEAGLESVEDPSGAMLMVERALLSAQDRDPDEAGNWGEEDLYRPRYLAADTATIAVPALTFVNMEGTRGLERSYYPLEVAELVASGALAIPDSTARTYFERLAADEAMQAEVRAAWDGTFLPHFRANERAFVRAFADHLRAVRLDVPPMNGVPVVTGYEYLTAPELIEAHVRSFLEEVARLEALPLDPIELHVGEPYDFRWVPKRAAEYVLRIMTRAAS